MHSKRRYKICICSVILGELESSKLPGLSIVFSKILDEFYESENFSDSSRHRIFESENFRFPFYTKIAYLTRGVKCEDLNVRKL